MSAQLAFVESPSQPHSDFREKAVMTREALLLDAIADLSTLLAFAGSVTSVIKLNSSYSPQTLATNAQHIHDDVAWLAELVCDVQSLAVPIALGLYAKAWPVAESLGRSLSWLTNKSLTVAGSAWPAEQEAVAGMLERWSTELRPTLPSAIKAFDNLALTCKALGDHDAR